MLRSAVGKVMWVGRATVFLVGLAVILALVFGATSTAFAHKGDRGFFHLAHKNVANKVSTLIKRGAGPALNLKVESGPPLSVNSSERVTGLNADQLDGKSDTDFYAAGSKVDDAAHADTADSATSAQTADSATNAQTASNATNLGGVAASNYVQNSDPRLSNAQISFNIVNGGTSAWLIGNPSDYDSGSNANPTLVLMRGMTYRFNVNALGHPFRIATSNGGPSYNVGVTNNDVMSGTLAFKVPMDAPNTLHYYCLAHPAMNGVISIPS